MILLLLLMFTVGVSSTYKLSYNSHIVKGDEDNLVSNNSDPFINECTRNHMLPTGDGQCTNIRYDKEELDKIVSFKDVVKFVNSLDLNNVENIRPISDKGDWYYIDNTGQKYNVELSNINANNSICKTTEFIIEYTSDYTINRLYVSNECIGNDNEVNQKCFESMVIEHSKCVREHNNLPILTNNFSNHNSLMKKNGISIIGTLNRILTLAMDPDYDSYSVNKDKNEHKYSLSFNVFKDDKCLYSTLGDNVNEYYGYNCLHVIDIGREDECKELVSKHNAVSYDFAIYNTIINGDLMMCKIKLQ